MPVHRYAVQSNGRESLNAATKGSQASQLERILTMLDSLERAREAIAEKLGWLPENAVGAGLLIIAILIALALHGTVRRLIRRMLRDRPSYALSLFASGQGLTRFALIILAVTLALPFVRLDPNATPIIARLLLLATIALIGWIALIAV